MNTTTRTVTKTEWHSWTVVAHATQTTPVIRRGPDGQDWAWVTTGKRVTIKAVLKTI